MEESKVIKRKRGIGNAIELLKIFFLYASSCFSFRMLSLCASALSVADISDTAWRRQFKKSIPFLHCLLDSLLNSLNLSNGNEYRKRKLFAVDASTFRQEGKEQKQNRIHISYDLVNNCINQVKITDIHTAESFHNFELEENAIYLADAGYGTARNYAHINERNADVILRISPNHFNLYTREGEKFDLHAHLKELKKNKVKFTSKLKGYGIFGNKYSYVRIIIFPLGKKEEEEARRKKQKKSQKNGNKIKETTLVSAGIVLLYSVILIFSENRISKANVYGLEFLISC